MAARIITLTTDFGLTDNYVGAVKGAILSIAPDVQLVDITHAVGPQDIAQAVYLTSTSWPHFPNSAIHIAVVDPGVGTNRRAVLLEGPNGAFIGPDNGVLSAALPPSLRPAEPGPVELTQGYLAIQLTEPAFFGSHVSNTFHARDIFGPVAAHISCGVDPTRLGPPVGEVHALPLTSAQRQGDRVEGRVVHIDTYGNVITDIPESFLPGRSLRVNCKGRVIPGLGRTYGESSGLFALVTSDGWLALALPNGSAREEIGAQRGDPVAVSP